MRTEGKSGQRSPQNTCVFSVGCVDFEVPAWLVEVMVQSAPYTAGWGWRGSPRIKARRREQWLCSCRKSYRRLCHRLVLLVHKTGLTSISVASSHELDQVTFKQKLESDFSDHL